MIHSVHPVYPKAARKAHIEGEVLLNYLITKTGDVREIHIVSGNPALVPAAIEAVKQWRYTPCIFNGEPTETRTTVSLSFTLHQ